MLARTPARKTPRPSYAPAKILFCFRAVPRSYVQAHKHNTPASPPALTSDNTAIGLLVVWRKDSDLSDALSELCKVLYYKAMYTSSKLHGPLCVMWLGHHSTLLHASS
ncbi:hypothetical protein Tco_1369041 [Tanacetum coccineum]